MNLLADYIAEQLRKTLPVKISRSRLQIQIAKALKNYPRVLGAK